MRAFLRQAQRKGKFLTSLSLSVVAALIFSAAAPSQKPSVTLVRIPGDAYDEMSRLMRKEMQRNYEIDEIILKDTSSFSEFKETLQKKLPGFLLLMDNRSIRYALDYNASVPDASKRFKGVAILGLDLGSVLKGIPEFSGVAYEPAPLLLITQFRYLLKTALRKVYVFYRKSFSQNKIDETTQILKGEGVFLDAIDVEQEGSSSSEIISFLKKNLRRVVRNAGPDDALWLHSDPAIINQDYYSSLWLLIVRNARIPIISSADNLLETKMHFCTFSVTPNLPDLASQAMQQVDAIVLNHQNPSLFGVEEAISVNKIFNVSRAKEIDLNYDEDHLIDVKVIK